MSLDELHEYVEMALDLNHGRNPLKKTGNKKTVRPKNV